MLIPEYYIPFNLFGLNSPLLAAGSFIFDFLIDIFNFAFLILNFFMLTLFLDSKPKIKKRFDNRPPIHKGPDFGIFFLGRVNLGNRHLSEFVFELQHPEVNIVFQFIGGKPVLPDIDLGIVE